MARRINSKDVDEAIARLIAVPQAPVEGSPEFNELLHWYQQAGKLKYKKGRADSAATICHMYMTHRQFTKLLPYLHELKSLCEESGKWTDRYADCLLMCIETDCTFGKFDEAGDTANKFLNELINLVRPEVAINAYLVIGNMYKTRGWNIKALRVFHQGIVREEEFKHLRHFLGLYSNYALSLLHLRQYDRALAAFKAVIYNKELPLFPYFLAHNHRYVSQIYADGFGDYEKCMEHKNISLEISREHGIKSAELQMLMAHAMSLTNLKRYDEALTALQNEEAIDTVRENPTEYSEILNARAECLLYNGKPAEAWKWLQQAEKMLHHSDTYSAKIKYYENCSQYYMQTGNGAAAAQSRSLRDKAQDESLRLEFAVQLEQVDALMDLEKKQHQLEMEKIKQEKIQQALDHVTQEKEMLITAIDQRNTLIEEFQSAISKIERSDMKRGEIFKTLNEKIASVKNNSYETSQYDVRFNEKHKANSLLLSKKYPKLSSAEIKIAIMLATGHSNKEIASITITTVRNIENHRLQLRKKMDLKKSDDLIKVLLSVLN